LKNILLVAGSDHRKIANSLKQLLLAEEIQLHIITIKSQRDILVRLIKECSQAIWLVSPQTVQDKRYLAILQGLNRKGVSILPVIVVPVDNLPFSISAIRLNRNHNQTVSEIIQLLNGNKPSSNHVISRKLAIGATLLGILLIVGIVSAILIQETQRDTLLPTFVALNSLPLSTSTTLDEILITESATDESEIEIPTTTTPIIISEATEEVTQEIEETDEANFPEATLDVEPESTESVEPIGLADEPIDSVFLDAGGLLLADFSADPQRGDAPLKVNITNLSAGGIEAYRWDYETDGVIDSTDFEPPTIIYETPGIYTLTLTTRDVSGNIVESVSIIEVYDVEDSSSSKASSGSTFASFESSPSSGQFPLSVRFINRSLGSNLTFEWDFNGDSQVDFIGPSPSAYEFTKPGTYTARLDVISPNGSRERAETQINVYSSSPDNSNEVIYDSDSRANFEVLPSTGTVPFRVTIHNLSVGSNNSYEWDFNGDNIPDSASAQPPEQRYADSGLYTISLTVYGFDRFGNSKISRAQIKVLATSAKPPNGSNETYAEFGLEADFVADTFQGTAPLTVAFYNYSTGEILDYQWDFNNDGVIDSAEFEPIHTFNSPGNYEVLLRVSDGTSFNETSLDIEVLAPSSTKTPLPVTIVPKTATPTVVPTIINGTATLTRTPTPTLTQTGEVIVITRTTTPNATTSGTTATVVSKTPTSTAMPASPSVTSTASPTTIPTLTATMTTTNTATTTPSRTPTPIPTNTAIPTATNTPTVTSSPLPTQTSPPSNTPDPEA